MSKTNNRLTSAFAALLATTLTVVASAAPDAVQARTNADCTSTIALIGQPVRL